MIEDMTCCVGSTQFYSYHTPTFVGLAPCESEDKIILICHVTTWSMFHVTLWVRSLCPKSPPCKVWGSQASWKWRLTSLICHVTTGWYAMWLYGWGPSILSHQPAKFGIHMPSKSRDITSLICHVTMWSMYHVTLWVGFPHPRSPRCKIWDL